MRLGRESRGDEIHTLLWWLALEVGYSEQPGRCESYTSRITLLETRAVTYRSPPQARRLDGTAFVRDTYAQTSAGTASNTLVQSWLVSPSRTRESVQKHHELRQPVGTTRPAP